MPLYTKNDGERRSREKPRFSSSTYRSPYRRDYARLIHSPSFRRLQGKTQLFPGHESDFFRNRLTHSLEVAQVAKTIALKVNSERHPRLGEIDTDLIEFAALCHDLGHPPFGHNGEHALDDCMKEFGGFEGNAQTLRILARLEKKSYAPSAEDQLPGFCGIEADGTDRRLGLDPTYRSLAAVLKYDSPIPASRPKGSPLAKGYYASESDVVTAIKQNVAPGFPADEPFKTIECSIMDIADDIAYSTYDLEDAFKGGFLTPLTLLTKLASDNKLLEQVTGKVDKSVGGVDSDDVLEAVVDLFARILPNHDTNLAQAPDPLVSAVEASLASQNLAADGHLRTELTSDLVNNAIEGVEVTVNRSHPQLSRVDLRRETKIEVESLKHLTFELIIQSSQLKVVEYRGYEMVSRIFGALVSDEGYNLLPPDFRFQWHVLERAPAARRMRLVCDFVAGMTDRYAIEFYERLFGSGQTMFKPL